MGDDLAQTDQDESKFKGLNRLRGKLSVFRKHPSKEANEVEVDQFLRPNSVSPDLQTPLTPRLDSKAAKAPAQGGPQVPIFPRHPRANVPDKQYPFEKYQPHRPSRSPGLAVDFARYEPELIGEGGDEAEDPPIVVSHQRPTAALNDRPYHGTPAKQHVHPGEEISSDIPIIRRPLRRAPTGFDEIHIGPNDSRPASNSSLEETPSSAQHGRHGNPSSYDFLQNWDRGQQWQPSATQTFQGYTNAPRNRLSLAHDSQQRQPEKSVSRSKTLPYKGLRRMQADEGLVHRSSVRGSMQDAPPEHRHRPSSSRSSLGVSPPRLPVQQMGDLNSERSVSQQSRRSVSPQPYANHPGFAPSNEHGDPYFGHQPGPSEKSTASTSQQTQNHHPYHVHSSMTENSDALPPPYQEVPPPQGYQVPREDKVPAISDQRSYKTRVASPNRPSVQQEKPQRPILDPDSAMQKFADRVSGTFAIFDLAEERNRADIPKLLWLRIAIWWFLQGRTELRTVSRGSKSTPFDPDSLHHEKDAPKSMQCYVDLAKTWWIMMRVTLQQEDLKATNGRGHAGPASNNFDHDHGVLMQALKALAVSLQKRDMMPPKTITVQGVDTRIWLPPSPRQFPPEWMWTLSSKIFQNPDDPPLIVDPLHALPIGDTESTAYLGRVFAETTVMYGDELPQYGSFPCVLSLIRNKSNMELQLVISSQNNTLYVVVQNSSAYGIRWEHIRWDTEEPMLRVKLPNKLRLRIFCSPADCEFLRTQGQGSQTVTTVLKPRHDEMILQTLQLNMFQYSDSANPTAFPSERQTSARVAVFERVSGGSEDPNDRVHQGYRISFVMADSSKPSVNLVLDDATMIEYALDLAHPDMQLRINEIDRCRRALIGFQSLQDREMFRDFVSGTVLGPEDNVILKTASNGTTISLPDTFVQHSAVTLHWRILQVLESIDEDVEGVVRKRKSVKPYQNRRIMMYDKLGSILTRLSSAVGAIQIRVEAQAPTALKMLHTSHSHRSTVTAGPDLNGADTMQRVFDLMRKPNVEVIQTWAFANTRDLHLFQNAVTGYQVLFDGVAVHFSIPRRRMYVPITQAWGTTGARVQIVRREGLLRLIAFFEGYELADSLNFQVKSSDAFEKVDVKASKGHGDERKPTPGGYGVKFVDAKFLLPGSGKDNEDERNGVNVVREVGARFVSLDVDEYAMEHEDITVAFETEQERDGFAEALPAPVVTPRSKFTLMRRI